MTSDIKDSSIVKRARDQVSADLDGEAVILNLKNGVYYSLDRVGTYIWDLLKEPIQVGEIRSAILEEYDVEANRCERDLLNLLEKLASEELIDVVEE